MERLVRGSQKIINKPDNDGRVPHRVLQIIGQTRDFIGFYNDFESDFGKSFVLNISLKRSLEFSSNLDVIISACEKVIAALQRLAAEDTAEELSVVQAFHESSRAFEVIVGIYEISLIEEMDSLDASTIDSFDQEVQRFKSKLASYQKIEEANNTATEVVRIAEKVRTAAGEVGDVILGRHFQAIETRERSTANRLRLAAAFILVAIGLLAIATLLRSNSSSPSIATVLLHVVGILPFGILGAYLGRESSKHRLEAEWAAEYNALLMTFDAFIAPLSAANQNDLRHEFGKKLFVNSRVKQAGEPGPSTLNEISTLIDRFSPSTQSGKSA
ncbi:hypothetical protein [Actinokineospora spheciospongiae]|uniref:hypothetical protein n=1 Tax=Actinokineospora spheciospongiae TaxID=909613 RepID=UPI001269470A|nr:hypothetical protein [Actinokineospora spheciospongiae]